METAPVRIGICGCDSSHAPAFAELIHSEFSDAGAARITGYYPGGSPDMEASRTRVEEFAARLDALNIPRCHSLDELSDVADHFLLTRADARLRMADFEMLSKRASSIFVDKPLALTAAQAGEILKLANHRNIRLFSSSAMRFSPGLRAALGKLMETGEEILHVELSGPLLDAPPIPGPFWYGIHTVEMLFAILGEDLVVDELAHDGAIIAFRAATPNGKTGRVRLGPASTFPFHGCLQTATRCLPFDPWTGAIINLYRPLVGEIVNFFKGGIPPVAPAETVRLIALLEAI